MSSSAHLLLVPWAAKWEPPFASSLTFAVALHLGTAAAVFGALAAEWKAMALAALRGGGGAMERVAKRKLGAILAATALVGAAAFLSEKQIEEVLQQPAIAASALIVGGAVLAGSDRLGEALGARRNAGVWVWLVIGVSQAIALVPGVSRSGITMSVGRLFGVSREEAAMFSFQLMGPVVLAAGAWRGARLIGEGAGGSELALLATGALVSGLAGGVAARWLLGYVRTAGFGPFAAYRIAVGLAALGLLAARA